MLPERAGIHNREKRFDVKAQVGLRRQAQVEVVGMIAAAIPVHSHLGYTGNLRAPSQTALNRPAAV